jgi:hypothetical protein
MLVKITNTSDARTITSRSRRNGRTAHASPRAFDLKPGQTAEQRADFYQPPRAAERHRVQVTYGRAHRFVTPETRPDQQPLWAAVQKRLRWLPALPVHGYTATRVSVTKTGRFASSDPYEQTWRKPFRATTCGEWPSDMSAQQRFAAVADMLAGGRNKGDVDTGLPPDSLIRSFEGDVSEACVFMEMTIDEISAGI